MKKKSQKDRVLEYMLSTGSITSWEAIKELGCTRLSAQIYCLRKAGWVIDFEPVSNTNRWGDKVVFYRYYIAFTPTGKRARRKRA